MRCIEAMQRRSLLESYKARKNRRRLDRERGKGESVARQVSVFRTPFGAAGTRAFQVSFCKPTRLAGGY